ncbi:electron transfer flavoprotein subunit alpha/FixB family protein [Marinimicrobium sp. ABcell2]|uniref:electron transfer flavoprotein subunit alpha/FixB family protein n=1 Tax=Marinimicrobium sp. ABcell2 TaxID=3069751 RepID=UPI0027B506A6|nr:FAD-binding protein [Marinimicrobium sp. ABcell2]MDQ2078031.1 FAD-binding protein [Marinimicrobium sp. ABcell2]
MKTLIYAEHDNQALKSSTLNAVTAGLELGQELHLLVVGHGCGAVANAARNIQGVSAVLVADAPVYDYQLPENVAPLLEKLTSKYSHILAPATTTGKNIIPRAAALADVQPIADVVGIETTETFVRPIYAGNLVAKVSSTDSVKMMTIRTSAFEAAAYSENPCEIEELSFEFDAGLSTVVGQDLATSDRPELTTARVVVSGGRALQSAENFQILYSLADKLGGAVGASRAAVDAGYVPNDLQVGQTGKIVSPELYIAVGISGAVQHLAGMKDSKVIVAINKDEDAPIFEVADYGLVADLYEAVPELEALLTAYGVEVDAPVAVSA